MSTTIPQKDPAATLDYQVDWTAWLAEGETIQGAPEIEVDEGITLNPDDKTTTVAGGKVTFWLAGGVAGQTYTVGCEIATSQGRVDRRSFRLSIASR